MKARGRKRLRKLSRGKSNKLKLTPWGKKTLLCNLAKCWEVTYNSQPSPGCELKSASFSSSCGINYDFKAQRRLHSENGSPTRALGSKETVTSNEIWQQEKWILSLGPASSHLFHAVLRGTSFSPVTEGGHPQETSQSTYWVWPTQNVTGTRRPRLLWSLGPLTVCLKGLSSFMVVGQAIRTTAGSRSLGPNPCQDTGASCWVRQSIYVCPKWNFCEIQGWV